jgi:hypothetical protein
MKRWLAVTVTGAVLALGAPAGAQDTDTHISAQRLMALSEGSRDWFLLGLMDGVTGSGRFTCGAIRRNAILAQVTILMKEQPGEKALRLLFTALEQLGCTDILAEKPSAKPAYSGPSS